MNAVVYLTMLSTRSDVTVVFDVSFLVLAVLGASIVVPQLGALFLGVWCGLLNEPTPPYRTRCLAYSAGYAASLLMSTLMMLLVKDAGNVPGWFIASLFGQGVAIHAVVVPFVLKTSWGKQTVAQALTLVLYGAVLVVAMAPIIIHVRRAVERGEWTAELQKMYRVVTDGEGMGAATLPETLGDVEKTGPAVVLLPGHHRDDLVYLGDYVRANYPSTLTERFVASMPNIIGKTPETSPLIWRNPKNNRSNRLGVCSYNGTVSFLSRQELDYHLTRTLLELDKIDMGDPATDTPPDDNLD